MNGDLKQKIICLGLGRTGVSPAALIQLGMDALDMLGFGPSYHMSTIMESGGKGLDMWCKIGDGNATSEEIDGLLHDYGAILDYPAAMYTPELFATYPDAKYILTVRDPAKWEKSMRNTIMETIPLIPNISEFHGAFRTWCDTYMLEKYHRGRLYTDTQQELLDHNERVKQIIPTEQLLIYEVGEGWDRLVEFLGIPKPTEPFPHVNDTATFRQKFQKALLGLEVATE